MAKRSLLEQLKSVSATTFENIAFDLVSSSGLRNTVWRTPGADGGRDIEGEYVATDMTGNVTLQKWYVECKRYRQTVDWPTVHPKLAYATNHGADFLLLITTGLLSPQCKSEIALHESGRAKPAIRVWDATVLAKVVATHPVLLVKYGFSAPEKQVIAAFLPLSLILARAVEASYGQSFQTEPGASLEFAASAAELLWIRVKEATDELPLCSSSVDPNLDLYPWLTVVTPCDFGHFDRYGFRALICGIRYVAGAKTLLTVSKAPGSSHGLRITTSNYTWSMRHAAARTLLEGLSAWSNAHVLVLSDDTLTMEPQDVD